MFFRLRHTNIHFDRPKKLTNYTMLKHKPSPKNPNRVNLVNKALDRYKIDGLNNLKYKLNGIVKYPLFTHLQIDVGESS